MNCLTDSEDEHGFRKGPLCSFTSCVYVGGAGLPFQVKQAFESAKIWGAISFLRCESPKASRLQPPRRLILYSITVVESAVGVGFKCLLCRDLGESFSTFSSCCFGDETVC